jgi:hypothetical protein
VQLSAAIEAEPVVGLERIRARCADKASSLGAHGIAGIRADV